MPRIITPPDLETDRTIPKILIRNAPWTDDEIRDILLQLSDAPYDIYLYNNEMNDIQWFEGVRNMSRHCLDWRHHKDEDPVEWLKTLDDLMK